MLDSFAAGATTASGHRLFHKSISGIQNGNPDGLAVVNTATSEVLQFISYGGAFTATSGPAAGMTSTDVGNQQDGEVVGEASLGLSGQGAGAVDFTWTKFDGISHSPGQPNAGQMLVASFLPSQGLAIDNLSVTFLTDGDSDGQSDAYENAFGSDPLDATSRFVPVIHSALELTFPGAVGISYVVEFSVDLTVWEEHSVHEGTGETVVVPLPAGETRMFFRLRAGG